MTAADPSTMVQRARYRNADLSCWAAVPPDQHTCACRQQQQSHTIDKKTWKLVCLQLCRKVQQPPPNFANAPHDVSMPARLEDGNNQARPKVEAPTRQESPQPRPSPQEITIYRAGSTQVANTAARDNAEMAELACVTKRSIADVGHLGRAACVVNSVNRVCLENVFSTSRVNKWCVHQTWNPT